MQGLRRRRPGVRDLTTSERGRARVDEAEDTTAAEETTEESADDAAADDGLGTVVDVAVENDFTTLVAAVEAADLVETLSGEGPFTVFAPTDEAFDALLADLGITAEELLADTELLTSVLTYHVLPDEVLAETVVTLYSTEVETVNGASVPISVEVTPSWSTTPRSRRRTSSSATA